MEETGTVRIFIHGLESSNQGTKAVFFREKFPDMITPNFPGDLQQRMDKLEHMLSSKSEIRIVGSSFGGLMATIFAIKNTSRVKRMVLLAPAINIVQFTSYRNATVSIPVHIYHGRNDEVIPISEVEPVAKQVFEKLTFNPVDDDHYLHDTFKTIDWETLLA